MDIVTWMGYGNSLISKLIPPFLLRLSTRKITSLYLLDILGRVLSDLSGYMQHFTAVLNMEPVVELCRTCSSY